MNCRSSRMRRWSRSTRPFMCGRTAPTSGSARRCRPSRRRSWPKVTGLPVEKVAVHNQYLGGGFGRRLEADSIGQAVQFAKQVAYPIKIIWTREEDIQHDMYRPAYYDRLTAGLGPDGLPIAWVDHVTGGSVTAHYDPRGLPEGKLDPDAVEGAQEPPYDFPAIHVDWIRQDPPIPDYLVARRRPDAQRLCRRELYRRMRARGRPRPRRISPRAARQESALACRARSGRREVRLGQAAARRQPDAASSLHDSFGSHIAVVAEVTVTPAGEVKLKRVTVAIDCGQTINPDNVIAQMEGGLVFGFSAALYSDITFKNGRVEQSNFNDYRMMRMNETPTFDVHHHSQQREPRGHRRDRDGFRRAGARQCDLRGHGQAPAALSLRSARAGRAGCRAACARSRRIGALAGAELSARCPLTVRPANAPLGFTRSGRARRRRDRRRRVLLLAGVAPRRRSSAIAALPAGAETIKRGEYLARAADCAACHTLASGKPYAGGLPFHLPMGTIYATNITPDKETGIGNWSDAEFVRAMHSGVAQGWRRSLSGFPVYVLRADEH